MFDLIWGQVEIASVQVAVSIIRITESYTIQWKAYNNTNARSQIQSNSFLSFFSLSFYTFTFIRFYTQSQSHNRTNTQSLKHIFVWYNMATHTHTNIYRLYF